ncbi:hypothetical protein quinque_002482 [Culex quinquefasciatus]
MDDTKRILIRVGIDFVILCCVGFPILIFFLIGQPYKRGFFCDDESLMHPFHDSTVTIIGTELVRAHVKKSDKQPLKVYNITVPYWVVEAYKSVGVFGFGAACSQLLTDVGKYTIGRLRPHFFDFLLILLAWYTCLSRISDYKHHWSDVLAGAVLGSTVAIVVSNYCSDLFDARRKRASTLPQTRYELNPNHPTTNGNQ